MGMEPTAPQRRTTHGTPYASSPTHVVANPYPCCALLPRLPSAPARCLHHLPHRSPPPPRLAARSAHPPLPQLRLSALPPTLPTRGRTPFCLASSRVRPRRPRPRRTPAPRRTPLRPRDPPRLDGPRRGPGRTHR